MATRKPETPRPPPRARPPRPGRQPGRPLSAGSDLREALVDAALHAFATAGYAASTLSGIARDAGVTPAMAHYYFGDKAGLLAAVVELRVQPLAARIVAAVGEAGDDPLAALEAFGRNYATLALQHPWIPRLVVREVLGEGGVLREGFGQRFAAAVGTQLVGRIRIAQSQGRIDAALDAPTVALSLLSLCIFPVLTAPVIPPALGVPLTADRAAALMAHQWRVFLSGVEARP